MQLDDVANAVRVGDAACLRRVHEDDRELIAPVPGDDAEAARVLHEELGDLAQGFVAGAMAEPVVDLLEVVEVHERERERLAEAAVALEFLLDPDREVATVVHVRQRVLERKILQPGVAQRDGRLRRQRAHEALVLGVEGHDASPIESVDELEHAENVVRRVLERNHQDRLRAVVEPLVDARVEGVGSIRRDHVRVVQVEDIAGQGHVTGEAQLPEAQGLSLETAPHFVLTQFTRQLVVLDDGKAEHIAFAEEQGPGLGVGEPTGFGEDPFEQRREILLAGQGDPDLHELSESLGQVHGRRFRLLRGTLPATASEVRIRASQKIPSQTDARDNRAIRMPLELTGTILGNSL